MKTKEKKLLRQYKGTVKRNSNKTVKENSKWVDKD
jgi:hypothetical protein